MSVNQSFIGGQPALEAQAEAQADQADLDAQRSAVNATPAAEAHAAETGVDLTQVEGSGADGRIVKQDVVEVASAPPAPLVEGEVPQGASSAAPEAASPAPAESILQRVEQEVESLLHPGAATTDAAASEPVSPEASPASPAETPPAS